MKSAKKLWLAVMVSLLTLSGGLAQQKETPGNIKLLPGYHHEGGMALDSFGGTISKQDGLRILYDIGDMAGNYTECGHICGWTDGEVWRKKQEINGQTMVSVYTEKRMLIVTFLEAHANFYATIESQEQMADMLLMIATFQRATFVVYCGGKPCGYPF